LRRLFAVTAALAETSSASDVVEVLLGEGRAALGATSAAVFLAAEGGDDLEIQRSVGYPDEAVEMLRSVPLYEPVPVAEAFRERRPVWVATREDLRGRYPKHERVMLIVGGHALVAVPLIAAGRPSGAAVFQFAGARPFDEGELELLVAIARQCAQALERARLLDRERAARRTAEGVALALQRSLLPPALPPIPGIDLAVRYRPAGDATQVGGDFYDVFETEGGFGAVLGDVSGKGATAAAIVGIARYTVRTAALGLGPPSAILRVLNEALLSQTEDHRFCTVCYARLRPGRGRARLTICCGGHPLPIVVRGEGMLEPVGRHGTIIGALPEPTLVDSAVDLGPGDAIVLYSDGVTEEGRGGAAFGEERLREVLRGCSRLTAAETATRVVRAVEDFGTDRPRDDIAVLVMRVRGFSRRLPATPAAAAEGRGAVDELIGAVPDPMLESIRLLVSELVTNAVRHARIGPDDTIELRAAVMPGSLRVEVRDRGPGFEARPSPPTSERESGWGLVLVDRMSDRWGVERGDAGSCVWFEVDLPGPQNWTPASAGGG
jgi:serine phosphatase RsbU (regulator of sigma subunit)